MQSEKKPFAAESPTAHVHLCEEVDANLHMQYAKPRVTLSDKAYMDKQHFALTQGRRTISKRQNFVIGQTFQSDVFLAIFYFLLSFDSSTSQCFFIQV